jgi:hypothetical protein
MAIASRKCSPDPIGVWRRFARCGIRSVVLGALAATVIGSASAQSSITLYGYSRETLPGIPSGPAAKGPGGAAGQSVFPIQYFLFVQVKRGSQVAADWVWVRGSYYACTLTKVTSPVTVAVDPNVPTNQQEILVPKSKDDVYRIDLGNMTTRAPSSEEGKRLVSNNQAVIALSVNKLKAYAALQSIRALRPAAAM